MIRKNERFLTQIYVICDAITIQLVFLLCWWLKFKSGIIEHEDHLPFETYFLWNVFYTIIAVIVGYMFVFYSPKRKKRFSYEAFKITQTHMISLFILLSVLFIFKEVHISRTFLLVYLVGNICFLGIYRYLVKMSLKRLRQKGYNKQFVLVLGAGSVGRQFYENLQSHPELGYEIVGFLDDFLVAHELKYSNYKPILGTTSDLENVLKSSLIDEVVVALPIEVHHKYAKVIDICEKSGIKVSIIPDFFDILPAKPSFDNFAGIPIINVREIPLDEFRNRLLKRTFDIVFALTAIILTSPVMLFIILVIKITSPGPIIFEQERVGLNRRKFMMYKFRSMKHMPIVESDTQWTIKDDPRRTAFGSFLRKTSLDELPQFFNVLKGDMSVVGPRPERPYFVEQFKEEIPKYMIKHHIRPGITGWAQSNGLRGDTSIEERIKHDLFYIENWTFLFDIKIIIKTIINGFINKNAY